MNERAKTQDRTSQLIRPRYGILSLMLVTIVFCGMAAAGRYLMLAIASETSNKAVFVIFTLAAPGLMVVAMNTSRVILRLISRRR